MQALHPAHASTRARARAHTHTQKKKKRREEKPLYEAENTPGWFLYGMLLAYEDGSG